MSSLGNDSSASCLSLPVPQTFLEQSKTRFSKNYKGMSLSKITTTVGLNSKGALSAEGVGPSPEGAVRP